MSKTSVKTFLVIPSSSFFSLHLPHAKDTKALRPSQISTDPFSEKLLEKQDFKQKHLLKSVLYRVSQKTWEFSDEFDIVLVMN